MISDRLNDQTTYKMVEANCDAKAMRKLLRKTKII